MTFRTVLAALFAVFLAGVALPGMAHADVEIDVNQGEVRPLPIAVPAFTGSSRGAEMAQVITGNLERSGLFAPIDGAAFPERNMDIGIQPDFGGWKAINAQALINGAITVEADGKLRVDFRLWDVFSGEQLLGLQFTSTPENWRRVAHKISDAVYERLTGEKGYFDTRIVFVAESGPRGARVKRLMVMDQDGANPSSLTDGSYVVMTPRFSSNSQEITYMALRPTGSSIYLFNIETARSETLGRFPGMVFAPRFSPDGSKIVFNSDRGGSPQLYVMDANGGGARRISYGQGRYMTPVWSPNGDFIAFTKQTGSTFHIGVMRPDGSDERILTTSYLDEGPTWAPNGRVLMFFRETPGGSPRLWTVDITGRILRPAPYQGSGSDPAWSPLLN